MRCARNRKMPWPALTERVVMVYQLGARGEEGIMVGAFREIDLPFLFSPTAMLEHSCR